MACILHVPIKILLVPKGTVKFLNFGMPEILAVIYLKFKQRGQTLRVFCQNGANGIANSEDPDQTAPIWVCTVCPDVSVRKLRVIKVLVSIEI